MVSFQLPLHSTEEHASAAFLGSTLDTENRIKTILKQEEIIIDTDKALNHFREVIEDSTIISVEHIMQAVGSSQKSLSFRVDSHN